ncbi:hypothetical protein BDA96_01G197900 [Sorghum bicolor]|uniref:Uncharacterized protein n=1 Tax=Sorghum bicolor TaxID=4558 RepID=A0A921RZ90_SORBI|nr:hypothetical protein BDA96_01G197900 [Sorghum bicolor]
MRDLEPTLEADRSAGKRFLNQSTLQVESSLMLSACRSSTLQTLLTIWMEEARVLVDSSEGMSRQPSMEW